MYVIGDATTAASVGMWSEVIGMLKAQGLLGPTLALQCPRHPETRAEVATPDDFSKHAPEGGCNLPCPDRLSCGHKCNYSCHSEIMHKNVVCLESCMRAVEGCTREHACPKPCGEPCPIRCRVIVQSDLLPCGHRPNLQCCETNAPEKAHCPVKVEKKMSGCEHTITLDCGHKGLEKLACNTPCGVSLTCGHARLRNCSDCKQLNTGTVLKEDHGDCKQPCGRPYTACTHRCGKACHGEEPCELCQSPCEVHCGHSKCEKKCSEPCAPCAESTCDSHCAEHQRQCTLPCAAPCNWVPCSK